MSPKSSSLGKSSSKLLSQQISQENAQMYENESLLKDPHAKKTYGFLLLGGNKRKKKLK